MAGVSDRLATQLLLISRDPATGRLRHPGVLDIGLRAALFTDLLLNGHISQQRGGPFAEEMGVDNDRILDAVLRTVERRPGVAWSRWFRHVRVDRTALVGELVDAGRWTEEGGLSPRYHDEQSDAALAHAESLRQIAELHAQPGTAGEGVLAILTVMCGSITGRPRPRALRRELDPLLTQLVRPEVTGTVYLPRMLRGAAQRIRRPLRR